MSGIQKNIRLFKIDAFLGGLWPLSSLAIIYFQQITHSYALAMLVWSAANLTQTFGEIPTGIYSDKIGRRKTLIMAVVTAMGVKIAILITSLIILKRRNLSL